MFSLVPITQKKNPPFISKLQQQTGLAHRLAIWALGAEIQLATFDTAKASIQKRPWNSTVLPIEV